MVLSLPFSAGRGQRSKDNRLKAGTVSPPKAPLNIFEKKRGETTLNTSKDIL